MDLLALSEELLTLLEERECEELVKDERRRVNEPPVKRFCRSLIVAVENPQNRPL